MLLSCAAWGRFWHAARVRCHCDNLAAVQCISKRSCWDPPLMHLLQCLFYLEAFFQFELVAVHIPGVSNDLADNLSRDNLSFFLLKAPHMDPHPVILPPLLPQLLLDVNSTWSSTAWTRQFAATFTSA